MEHRVQLCPGALIEEGDKGPPLGIFSQFELRLTQILHQFTS